MLGQSLGHYRTREKLGAGGKPLTAPRRLRFGMFLCSCAAVLAIAPPASAQVSNPEPIWIKGRYRFVTQVGSDLWVCDETCYRLDTSTSPAGLIPLSLDLKGGFPLATAFGSLWVARIDSSFFKRTPVADPGLYRLDLKTGQEVKIPIGEINPFFSLIADGSIWVSSETRLYRVDPDTNQVTAEFPLEKGKKSQIGGALDIAVGLRSVWRLFEDGSLHRIDPETNQLLAEIHLRPSGRNWSTFADHYGQLAIGEGSLWIPPYKDVGKPDSKLIRIDLKTNQVMPTIPLAYRPGQVVVGGGFVWVSAYYTDAAGHFVLKVDPRSNRVVDSIFVRGTLPGLSAEEDGILAWGEELKRWGSPKRTYILKIPY